MTSTTTPATRQASRSTYLDVRGLRYHVREWGEPGAPILFLFHGWMDVSASFQFLVDALRERWHIVAPDWRGYGLTEWAKADAYWFQEFLADIDRLVAELRKLADEHLLWARELRLNELSLAELL